MKKQAGFTLIELIAVIVILGIIAAVAVPRFVDLSGAAQEASVKGVAGSLASASSLNYAASVAANAGLEEAPTPSSVANCTEVGALLEGGLPANFVITAAAIAEGESEECTVGFSDGEASPSIDTNKPDATFNAYGVDAS